MGLHQDAVHLTELAPDQRAARPGNVADVVQPQVVEDQQVPVRSLQHCVQVPRDIVIHLQGEVGMNSSLELPGSSLPKEKGHGHCK